MERDFFGKIDINKIHTPCFIVNQEVLKHNLEIVDKIQKKTGSKILLSLKSFAMYSVFPLLRKTLCGVSASSVNEAILGKREFKKEVHTYCVAYSEESLDKLLNLSDYIIFNSLSQYQRFHKKIKLFSKNIKIGIRINPEWSEVKTAIYDPCCKFSRLGVRTADLNDNSLNGISGIHFHNLCELNSDSLARTIEVVEKKMGSVLDKMEWINVGGGHLVTDETYNLDLLCELIIHVKSKYNINVYLEPGSAIAWNAGILVSSVLDIVKNEKDIAILDISAATHIPDVLEMPYKPKIKGAAEPAIYPYTYQLAGTSCLAGDIIGDYSFKEPLKIGSRIMLLDMAHYTMVKTNMFNGINLPAIALYDPVSNDIRIIRSFDYKDYKSRL
jgi:carboxynorspermidine decarboxylase